MRVACVGAVVRDNRGRLLMIQRGHPPAQGSWSLPGGRVEAGESDAEALAREVLEETGLRIRVGPLLGRVELAGPGEASYDVRDYAGTSVGGELRAGSDAVAARWVDPGQLPDHDCSPGLLDTLRRWGVDGV
jgi:8-oxo-dGTP diphosphatase